MGSFNLLKQTIRQYIYDQGWLSLTKIQEASIKYIFETDCNIVLSAPTASGKTEAAFLPAINSIEDWNEGLKIIYISPLVALINDQFKRINELCKYLQVNVTSWHGEASKSKKKKLLDNPTGILMITPESIEAMLSLRSGEARNLFKKAEWIIVDEIHGFLDNNRGLQLRSLLERMQRYMEKCPRYIGMSATLHTEDSCLIKDFFKNGRKTLILADKVRNKLKLTQEYYPSNTKGESDGAIKSIYQYSQEGSMLVFPNSRGDVEYIAVNLIKKAKINHSYTRYFAHHSALTKESRIFAENFAKTSTYELFTICCTSTLEMGIDIGSVDSIVQYNSPNTVASLGQRLGRSGRKTKENILHFIATNPWDLLQGLAAISLYEQGNIDRVDSIKKPYDVFAHQILSMLLERSGMSIGNLKTLRTEYSTWKNIDDDEYTTLIRYLLKENYIEKLEQEVITGIATEKLLKKGEFFSHFTTQDNFSVYNEVKKVGEIPLTPSVSEGVNVFLAAEIWKIVSIDFFGKKIFVQKAIDGNPPIFLSGVGNTSNEIRQRMKEILESASQWKSFDEKIQFAFNEIVSKNVRLENMHWIQTSNSIGFRTFAGSKINETLRVILNIVNGNSIFRLNDKQSLLYSNETDINIKDVLYKTTKQKVRKEQIIQYFKEFPESINRYIGMMKYKYLLPENLKIKYIIENIFDLEGTLLYIDNLTEVL